MCLQFLIIYAITSIIIQHESTIINQPSLNLKYLNFASFGVAFDKLINELEASSIFEFVI
jgi:hypothetical protein